MPQTIANAHRRTAIASAITDLKAHRAGLLILMRGLDRADLRLAHARLGATVSSLDDTIAALEAGQ